MGQIYLCSNQASVDITFESDGRGRTGRVFLPREALCFVTDQDRSRLAILKFQPRTDSVLATEQIPALCNPIRSVGCWLNIYEN